MFHQGISEEALAVIIEGETACKSQVVWYLLLLAKNCILYVHVPGFGFC